MTELTQRLQNLDLQPNRPSVELNQEVASVLQEFGYEIALNDYQRPWGGFNQLANENADAFIEEFFPGLTPEEARLGHADFALSPKILLVKPENRLSWQYHDRRAERWAYLTEGAYNKSLTDEQGEQIVAQAGEVVQFAQSERHRLVGAIGHYTLVAEIWQHTNPDELSDESDIIRLADDYSR